MSGLKYLSEDEKIRVILHRGKFLHTISIKGKDADLYELDGCWVEVLICTSSRNIEKVDVIGYDEVDKYLTSLPAYSE